MKMRNAEAHLLEEKMDEAVTHYINSHQPVHIDTNGIPMTVQDDGAGRVTVMHQQTYTTQMCRQVSVTEQVGEGPWGEELLEGPIAAIMAHLQNTRHHPAAHHKVSQMRNDVDSSVILDGQMRYNAAPALLPQSQPSEPLVVQLPALPALQDMKRGAPADWFAHNNKKEESSLVPAEGALELSASPAPHRHRKSLPHKKRISRKLKRNGNITPHQEVVVINCGTGAAPHHDPILPDTFVPTHHMTHEVRALFICQVCGEYYGEEQLKFYHHLKQHYEPHATIIIENPVADLNMDKMSNTCIVDSVATLPDSIVELSLENSVPKTMYQSHPIDKHILYSTIDKTPSYNTNKIHYSMAGADKERSEADKSDLYETLDKLELYNCGKCTKTFRKQKVCEAHVRDAHPDTKLEDMGEFSEPEDLMAGIQVCVEEPYEHSLPHLTVHAGTVTQDHSRHWYARAASLPRDTDAPLKILKEEVLQRMFESEVTENSSFGENIIPEHEVVVPEHEVVVPEHERDVHSHTHAHSLDDTHSHTHEHTDEHITHDDLRIEHEDVHEHTHHEHGQAHDGHGQTQSEHGHCLNEDELRYCGHDDSEHGRGRGDSDHEHDQGDSEREHGRGRSVQSEGSAPEVDESRNDLSREYDGDHGQPPLRQDAVLGEKVKQFSCRQCSRVFPHRNSLLYHALSHGGRQHACTTCGKFFYTRNALKVHRRVHNDDRPYKCDVCHKEFKQWSDLSYHKLSLHSDKKHFKCEYCGKEFARKYSLNIHVRIHTGERNYRCEVCGMTFRASSYRKMHMRTHTGDRPHKCSICEKSFRSAFDLRRHSIVHERLAPDVKPEPEPEPPAARAEPADPGDDKPAPPKRIKRVALASTARPPAPPPTTKTKRSSRKGAPNVTVHGRADLEHADLKHSEPAAGAPPSRAERRAGRDNTDGKMHVFTHVERARPDLGGSFLDLASYMQQADLAAT